MKIHIINGPNLNILGKRETKIYGKISFDSFYKKLTNKYNKIKLSYFQSNNEGDIISEIQKNYNISGILLNAGGYSHTSISIYDSIRYVNTPVIEIHISNIFRREKFRNKSIISNACVGIISGFSLYSYELGLISIINGYV